MLLISFGALSLQAQTLSGTITDAETQEALEGARVVVAGSTVGAISDAAGKYSLTLPEGAATIIVNYFGFATQRIEINGRSSINVQLLADAASLDDVVITALGIARDEKTLGYAAQELDGSSMTQAREPNFINAMAGRVAGVNITQGASGVGSSARMVIRGETSISGNNQPLFVVDGVPI